MCKHKNWKINKKSLQFWKYWFLYPRQILFLKKAKKFFDKRHYKQFTILKMNTFNKTERVFIEDKIKHLDVWWERFNKQSISLNNIETENYLLVISVPNQKMTLKRKKLFKSERFWYKRMKENERN